MTASWLTARNPYRHGVGAYWRPSTEYIIVHGRTEFNPSPFRVGRRPLALCARCGVRPCWPQHRCPPVRFRCRACRPSPFFSPLLRCSLRCGPPPPHGGGPSILRVRGFRILRRAAAAAARTGLQPLHYLSCPPCLGVRLAGAPPLRFVPALCVPAPPWRPPGPGWAPPATASGGPCRYRWGLCGPPSPGPPPIKGSGWTLGQRL